MFKSNSKSSISEQSSSLNAFGLLTSSDYRACIVLDFDYIFLPSCGQWTIQTSAALLCQLYLF
jgi:hypothetical protein